MDGQQAYIHSRSMRGGGWGLRNKEVIETPLVILAKCRVYPGQTSAKRSLNYFVGDAFMDYLIRDATL